MMVANDNARGPFEETGAPCSLDDQRDLVEFLANLSEFYCEMGASPAWLDLVEYASARLADLEVIYGVSHD